MKVNKWLNRTERFRPSVYLIILLAIISISWRLVNNSLKFPSLIPDKGYQVDYFFLLKSEKEKVFVKAFVPQSTNRQQILNEKTDSPYFSTNFTINENGKRAIWRSNESNLKRYIKHSFTFSGKSVSYNIDPSISIPLKYKDGMKKYLQSEEYIEVNHPEIQKLAKKIKPSQNSILSLLQSIHTYVYEIPSAPIKELTTAYETLDKNLASCNGKSRLFVALCRANNLPARLVGGMILKPGKKRTSHLWLEVYVEDNWVPFDALNNHFASIPANYMEIYRGDKFLISRSPNVFFDYHFSISNKISIPKTHTGDLMNFSSLGEFYFLVNQQYGISWHFIRILFLLPLAAVVVALFKNVIGLKTFGVFLPALISFSVVPIGFWSGLLMFTVVVGVVSLIHIPLEKLGLLHTPKLVIMLISVSVSFLLIIVIQRITNQVLFSGQLFIPIVITTITAERFAQSISENGFLESLLLLAQTFIVAGVCFVIVDSDAMLAILMTYPEFIIIEICIMILLGKWIGIRLTEYVRFSPAIK